MREIAFIKQNKEKWLDFEQAIFGKAKKILMKWPVCIYIWSTICLMHKLIILKARPLSILTIWQHRFTKKFTRQKEQKPIGLSTFFYRSSVTGLPIPKICSVCIPPFLSDYCNWCCFGQI